MLIRDAIIEDAPALAHVHVDTWRTTYRGIVPDDFLAGLTYEWSAEQRITRIRRGIEQGNQFTLTALDDGGEIVGFSYGGHERDGNTLYTGEIYALYILAHRQRSGIGRRLVAESMKRLRAMGHDNLLVWVLDDNPSRGFYEAIGGTIVDHKEIVIGGATLGETAYGISCNLEC